MTGQVRSDFIDRNAITSGHHQREPTLTVVAQEPVTDIRHVCEIGADRLSDRNLIEFAVLLVHQIDRQRRLAKLRPRSEQPPASDKNAFHLRPLLDPLDERIGRLSRIGEARPRRQLHGQQNAP